MDLNRTIPLPFIPVKTCTKCHQSLPVESFGADRNQRDGLFAWCKPCARAYQRTRRQNPATHQAVKDAQSRHRQRAKGFLVERADRTPKPFPTEKTCTRCGTVRPIEEFPTAGLSPTGRPLWRPECTMCRNERRQQARATNRVRLADVVTTVKHRCGCVVCGETEAVALDFHHISPGQKEFNIAMKSRLTWVALRRELGKCCVLCASCHRKVHTGSLQNIPLGPIDRQLLDELISSG